MGSTAITTPIEDATAVRRLSGAVLPIAFGILATAVSATGSWVPSLWGDEAASLLSATRPLPSLFYMFSHVDAVHGLYYLFLHAWIDLFGPSIFSIRLPSALAVGASAAAVVVLAARLGTRRLAILAGLMCVVLPRLTYAGEEARSFALTAAIAAWLSVLLAEIILRPTVRLGWYVGYAALSAIGVYLFMYLALVPVAHALILILVRTPRTRVIRWLVACGWAALAAVPIIIVAIAQRAQISYLTATQQVTPRSVLVTLWFGEPLFATLAWALIIVALIRWVGRAVRMRRGGGSETPAARLTPELFGFVVMFLPAALLILSNIFVADFTARYLAFSGPAVALLIGCGIDAVASSWSSRAGSAVVAAVLAVAVVATAAPVYLAQRGPYAKNNSDWNEIAASLAERAQPGDAVVFDDSVRPSRRPRLAMNTDPASFTWARDVLLRSPYVDNDTWYDRTYGIQEAAALGRFDGVRRVWLVRYAIGDQVDAWGTSDLASLGFQPVTAYRNYRSEVTLLTR